MTIEDYIAQLDPPRCHGDHLALALLKNHARRIAELDVKIAQAEEHSTRRYMLEDDRRCEQQVADAIGYTALAYREHVAS